MTRFRQHDLEVVQAPLDEIERHPENANQGDLDAIEQSISVNGFYQPVLVQSSTGYIIAGNHRWEAAKRMNADSIPAIFLDVSDEEAKRIMVADNRTTRLGHDDPSMLLELLDTLSDTEYGLLGTGYDPATFQSMLDAAEEPLHFDDEPDGDPHPTIDPYFVDIGTRSEDGEAISFSVSRRDGDVMSPEDLNRVREALGLGHLSRGVIAQYDVKGWE